MLGKLKSEDSGEKTDDPSRGGAGPKRYQDETEKAAVAGADIQSDSGEPINKLDSERMGSGTFDTSDRELPFHHNHVRARSRRQSRVKNQGKTRSSRENLGRKAMSDDTAENQPRLNRIIGAGHSEANRCSSPITHSQVDNKLV